MHGLLKALSVFGVSLILADSILTPAQSVLGAVQGNPRTHRTTAWNWKKLIILQA